MKLLIEITEEKYNCIKDKMYCGIYDSDLYKGIANGTPLPNSHGRLIDADKLIKTLNDECIPFESDINYFICNAQTIINADPEGGKYNGN